MAQVPLAQLPYGTSSRWHNLFWHKFPVAQVPMAQLPEAGDDGFIEEDQGDKLLQRITHDSREENSNSGKCLQLQWWKVSPVAMVEGVSSCK